MYCMLLSMIVIFTGIVDSSPMRFSTRLTGHLYNSVAGVSFPTCVAECQNVAGCRSVNYERRTQTCEINSRRVSDIPNLNTAAGGFVYWENQAVGVGTLQQVALTCDTAVCSRHESCDRQTGTCRAYACDPYTTPAHGTVLGNRNDVNSVVRVDCDSDDAIPVRSQTSMCGASGTWGDIAICEPICSHGWERSGQSCYKFSTTEGSWDECQLYCESIHNRMVIVNDQTEHEFLKLNLLATGLTDMWIGLRFHQDVQDFLWVDGSRVTFSAWAQQNRPNYGCVRMVADLGYLWYDSLFCTWKHRCVCEKGF